MSDPFIGEIRPFAGGYAPQGWLACDGNTVAINIYQALYTLLGTTFGGNGSTTFGLPDLRGRVAIHRGQGTGLSNFAYASIGGTTTVTLSPSQMPPHTHQLYASSTPATTATPGPTVTFGTVADTNLFYVDGTKTIKGAATNFSSSAISQVGGNQSHTNTMPSLAQTYIICWNGIFPSFN